MKRNKFSLSQYKLLTANLGQLVPCSLTEVLPGDSFQGKTAALVRTTPLAAPVMHPIQVRFHSFFCPTRLVFPEFEEFKQVETMAKAMDHQCQQLHQTAQQDSQPDHYQTT